MSEQTLCSQCGSPLTAGMCPRCMLKRGLDAYSLHSAQVSLVNNTFAGNNWTPPSVEEVGMRFAELEVQELIGRGGMGAVYKARQKNLDRVVALKILPPEIGRSPEFARRFAQEAQAMAKLSHPHIVPIHDFGQRGNFYYFIMEFMDGLNLRQIMNSGNVSPKEALAIVPQICEALQYAHNQGIVHRDIKPENILLNKNGEVKIADFGLAKLMSSPAPDQPQREKICGTPQYMAPEQVQRPGEVDHRADIYSLGVVFYQMLTGQLPTQSLEPPSKKVQIDVRLDQIVLRALDQSPELRFQNATQFKTEVETVMGVGRPAPFIDYPTMPVHSYFSRPAIFGVAWATFFFLDLSGFFIAANQIPGNTMTPRAGILLKFLLLLLGALGATAPFGTTILGCVSIAQIRRSAGTIYGLGMALFDALLFPLMILDGIIVLVTLSLFELSVLSRHTPIERTGVNLSMFILFAIFICGMIDAIIVRRTWRAINRQIGITTYPPRSQSPRLSAILVGSIIGFLVIAFLFVIFAMFIPSAAKSRRIPAIAPVRNALLSPISNPLAVNLAFDHALANEERQDAVAFAISAKAPQNIGDRLKLDINPAAVELPAEGSLRPWQTFPIAWSGVFPDVSMTHRSNIFLGQRKNSKGQPRLISIDAVHNGNMITLLTSVLHINDAGTSIVGPTRVPALRKFTHDDEFIVYAGRKSPVSQSELSIWIETPNHPELNDEITARLTDDDLIIFYVRRGLFPKGDAQLLSPEGEPQTWEESQMLKPAPPWNFESAIIGSWTPSFFLDETRGSPVAAGALFTLTPDHKATLKNLGSPTLQGDWPAETISGSWTADKYRVQFKSDGEKPILLNMELDGKSLVVHCNNDKGFIAMRKFDPEAIEMP